MSSHSSLDPFSLRQLGDSGLSVPALGFGGGTLGDPTEIISEDQAAATLDAAYRNGIRYFDTAPWYGLTKSEHRIGHYLRQKHRDSFSLNTKVGRVFSRPDDPETFHQDRWKGGLPFQLRFDYSRDGFQRSYEDSLQRLGLNSVDSLVVHDLDYKFHEDDAGVNRCLDQLEIEGGIDWLVERKSSGEIKAIGAGVNQSVMIPKLIERFTDWDFFLVAMPYTLLEQTALEKGFELCQKHNISVIIGAVFASGILAGPINPSSCYGYQPAEQTILEKARAIENVCNRYDVPLGAAALQFPLGHSVVASVIPGANRPDIVETNLKWIRAPIPSELWQELKAEKLIHPEAPTP